MRNETTINAVVTMTEDGMALIRIPGACPGYVRVSVAPSLVSGSAATVTVKAFFPTLS